jgi:photosystem II stability/assembly factor-like uncharacterized protein
MPPRTRVTSRHFLSVRRDAECIGAFLLSALLAAACTAPISQATPTPVLSPEPPAATAAPTPIPPSPPPSPTALRPTPSATATLITTPIPTLAGGATAQIRFIRMVGQTSGWAIGGEEGGDDHILVTADGGLTWVDVSPPEPLPEDPTVTKTAIGAFLDMNRAWVIYSSADPSVQVDLTTVWRTQDGGRTWQAGLPLDITGLDLFFPKYMGFSGPQDGWMMVDLGAGMMHEYIALFTTHDSGREWSRVLDPYGSSPVQGCYKTGLDFFDSKVGWMTRDCQGVTVGLTVETTLDGGTTWVSLPLPPPSSNPGAFSDPNVCNVHSPHLFSDYIGTVGVSCQQYDESKAGSNDPFKNKRSYLYRSEDGGGSWTISGYPGGELDFLSSDEVFALGRTISISHDVGATWQAVKTVAWDGQFSFVDDTNGWAVARSESAIAFVRTTNGGKTWQELQPVIQP